MSTYGKALSAYSKINRIKQATSKISEAQSMINTQRMKSISEAREVERRQQVTQAISGAIQTGGAIGMTHLGNKGVLNPKHANAISAGLGAAGSIATNIAGGSADTTGLTYGESRAHAENTNLDLVNQAMSGYTLQDSLNEMSKRQAMDDQITDGDNDYGEEH